MVPSLFLRTGLRLLHYQPGQTDLLFLMVTTPSAPCPLCQQPSRHVHSRYWRTLADLPLEGRPIRLLVCVRRFFCDNPGCQRQIFAQRLRQFANEHAQRTQRLKQAHTQIAQAVGSRPGVALALRLSMPTSATTLLRAERAAPVPQFPTPRVLGVDDWAFRKGCRYGTLLFDHERHQVVDLLPDRDPQTLAQWLKRHPGVEIVTRDRAQAYAEGIREGAPQAQQVADRFHLTENLEQALERVLQEQHSLLGQVARETPPAPTISIPEEPETSASIPPPAVPERETCSTALKRRHRQERLHRYEQVHALRRQGVTLTDIAARVGIHMATVRRFLSIPSFPERQQRAPVRRPHQLDPHTAYLRERCKAGCHNAIHLSKELRERGYLGSYETVNRFVRRLRDSDPAPAVPLLRVSPRQVAAWVMQRETDRTPVHTEFLTRLMDRCTPFRVAQDLADRFMRMIRRTSSESASTLLTSWLSDATACGVASLVNLAASLRQDEEAVCAGLSLRWSNGAVEGSVNRLKFVKRRGYGRANFELLRRRVLQRP